MAIDMSTDAQQTPAHVINAECSELSVSLTIRIDDRDPVYGSTIGRAVYLLREAADQLEQKEHRDESGVSVSVAKADS